MQNKILVAYATTHGSTQEIAAVVAEMLRAGDRPVDLLAARAVNSIEGYSAIVLGSPLYILHLHKDAVRFLARHQSALSRLPLAIFAGGPYGQGTEDEWREVRRELEQDLAKFPWLHPVSVQLVGGRFDPVHLRFPWNLIPAMRQSPPSDLRDWKAIRAWACALPEKFQPVCLSEEAR